MDKEISKDEALENAIQTSSRFHALFLKSEKEIVAKALITTNEIYHKPIRDEWEQSIYLHEFTHIASACKISNLKFLSLLTDILSLLPKENQPPEYFYNLFGLPKKFPLSRNIKFLDEQCAFFSEVLSLFLQIVDRSVTSEEFIEQIMADLKIHEPKKYEYLIKFNEIIHKFFEKKDKNNISFDLVRDISLNIFREIIDVAPKLDSHENLFKRFECVYNNIRTDDLTNWETVDEQHFITRRLLAKEGYSLRNILSPEKDSTIKLKSDIPILVTSLPDLLYFTILDRFLQADISEPFTLGIISDYDPAFWSTVYEIDNFEKNTKGRIIRCYLPDTWNLDLDNHFLLLLLNMYPKIKDKRLKQAFEEYISAINKIKSVKLIFSSCPGLSACKNKPNCKLLPKIHQRLREVWHPHAIKIDGIIRDILSDNTL